MGSRSHWVAVSSLLVGLLVLSGCALHHISAESTIEPDRIPEFKVAGPIEIVNAQQSSEDVAIPIPGFTVAVNYRQYTESAIKALRGELDRRAGPTAARTPKRVTLTIVDLRMVTTGTTFGCIINYTVETGDGSRRGIEVIAWSWRFPKAINAAVTDVAISVLNDEKILSYLEKRGSD